MAFVSSLVVSIIYYFFLFFLADSIGALGRNSIGDMVMFFILVATFAFFCCWFFVEKVHLKIKRDITPLHSAKKMLIILMEDNSIVAYFQEQQGIFKNLFSIKDGNLKSTQLFSMDLPSSEWKKDTNNYSFSIHLLSITQAVYSYYSQQIITTPCLLNLEQPSYSMLYPHIQNDLTLLQENKKINVMIDFQKQILSQESCKLLTFNLIYYFSCFLVNAFFSIAWGIIGLWIYLPNY